MPFSLFVPAFLSPRTRSAFSAGPRPVGRSSGAAAVLAFIVAIAAASLTAPASGSMVVTVEDTAEGLKFSYSGSLNITASDTWSGNNVSAITGGGGIDQFYSVTSNAQYVSIAGYTTSAPNGFFTESFFTTSTAKPADSGPSFGVRDGSLGMLVVLPNGYTGGTTLNGYGIISGQTIASTGFYDQVLTITSGSAAGETITLQATAVPEPSTWALGAFALACGGWQLKRRRRALGVKT